MFARLLFAAAIVGCVMTGCNKSDTPGEEDIIESIPFSTHGQLEFWRGQDMLAMIAIEIADTDSSRTRGLMQRASLPSESGMLFIFPNEEPQGFWMGNTQMSLDLIYVAGDSSIVSIAKYAQPMAQETIPSGAPAQYVVEVPAGYSDSTGLIEGDKIRWQRK
jgi:uncharacterized membrane protein (UPF0127 family)